MVAVQFNRFVEAMRPKDEQVRKQLYLGYSWDGQTAV